MSGTPNESLAPGATVTETVGRRRMLILTVIAIAVVICDQVLKIWVKTHFYLGEALPITGWWQLKFIENNGMAFGLELWNKLFLTIGRIGAVALFIWFVCKVHRHATLRMGFFVAMALIIAGAAGNIFDCVFYGVVFNNPMPPDVAVAFPPGGGYAGWFEGKVVDMLYFPLFTFTWPEWMPGVGGTDYEFFQYIFNIADSAICIGVGLLIIFYSADVSKAFQYASIRTSASAGKKNDKLK